MRSSIMRRTAFVVIGMILAGCLVFSFSGLYASTPSDQGAYGEEEEYTGQDTPDSIHVSTVPSETNTSHPETSHNAEHEADSIADVGHQETTGHEETASVAENTPSHELSAYQTTPHVGTQNKAEHDVEKTHQRTTERTQRNFSRSSDQESGFSTGAWVGLVGVLVVLGGLTFFFMKGTSNMKNMKLGTKIIGMVSTILLLMVISSGFGIIKVGSIGSVMRSKGSPKRISP